MHDLLEGTVQMSIKFVLRHLVVINNCFNVNFLNQRINNFRYGPIESKNKLSPNFSLQMLQNVKQKSIKQKAIQTFVLLRVFPFLIYHQVPQECHEYMRLIVILQKIVQMVFSSDITEFM